ncbi:hypothetical protein HB779_09025 [Phyllobacterium sp. 628]|uniref:hypothetical protein n=1 Tax=Phyllobacterium sp. 628 TaxID=2718938 RepID=UPI0016626625|nr:hypothetical protein [Phyllobacterium sp. 628]QND52036.1 hypothetical protein HB779_09025 [Phyllobacterium sp. 628]
MDIASPSSMQVWFTASELAAAAEGPLKGLPESKSGMHKRIQSEGWDRSHFALRGTGAYRFIGRCSTAN